MKKESHLCNPKRGEHKPESARLEGIENEQKGQAKRKIKFSKKNLQKEKRFLPLHSRNERREAESARLTAKK